MGSIKNNHLIESTHELNEEEFNYLMNVNAAKQNIVQEYDRVMSAFLKYIATSRLQYPMEDDLQFELDFKDKKHELKITKLPN
jgi:hypothetical protein